jgi:hypothetical protein
MKKTICILAIICSQKIVAQTYRFSAQLFTNKVDPQLYIQNEKLSVKCANGIKGGFFLSASAEWIKKHHFGLSYTSAQQTILFEHFENAYKQTNYHIDLFHTTYSTKDIMFNYRYDIYLTKSETIALKLTPTFDLGLSFMNGAEYTSIYYDKGKVTPSSINPNTGDLVFDLFIVLITGTNSKPYETIKGKGQSAVQGVSQLGLAWEIETKYTNFVLGYKYGLNKSSLDQWNVSSGPLTNMTAKTSHSAWYMGLGFHFGHPKSKRSKISH